MTNSQTNVTLKGEHNIMYSPNLTYKGGFLSCSAIPGNQISPSKNARKCLLNRRECLSVNLYKQFHSCNLNRYGILSRQKYSPFQDYYFQFLNWLKEQNICKEPIQHSAWHLIGIRKISVSFSICFNKLLCFLPGFGCSFAHYREL